MFKVGQKVVCINSEAGWLDGVKELVEGEIYTVNHIIEQINNIGVDGVSGCWNASRFRPLNNGWAEEILCKLIEEINEDERLWLCGGNLQTSKKSNKKFCKLLTPKPLLMV